MLPPRIILSTLLLFSIPLAVASPVVSDNNANSSCAFWQHFGFATRENAVAASGAKAEIRIMHKTTDEKGPTGQGLHDNLYGECGRENVSDWKEPTVLSTDANTGMVTGYNVWVSLGGVGDGRCVERAIQAAENQVVKCSDAA